MNACDFLILNLKKRFLLKVERNHFYLYCFTFMYIILFLFRILLIVDNIVTLNLKLI